MAVVLGQVIAKVSRSLALGMLTVPGEPGQRSRHSLMNYFNFLQTFTTAVPVATTIYQGMKIGAILFLYF